MVNSMGNFWRNCQTFFTTAAPLHIPTSNAGSNFKGSNYSISSPTLLMNVKEGGILTNGRRGWGSLSGHKGLKVLWSVVDLVTHSLMLWFTWGLVCLCLLEIDWFCSLLESCCLVGIFCCCQGSCWLRCAGTPVALCEKGGARDRGTDMQKVGQSPNHNDQGLWPKQPASYRSGFISKTGVPVGLAALSRQQGHLELDGQEHHFSLGGRAGRCWVHCGWSPAARDELSIHKKKGHRGLLRSGNHNLLNGVRLRAGFHGNEIMKDQSRT